MAEKQRRMINPRSTTTVIQGGSRGDVHQKTVTSTDLLTKEAFELQRAGKICSDVPGVVVPDVLGVDTSSRTLSTSHFHGDSLFNHIWNSSSSLARRVMSVRKATSIGTRVGQWLRGYHQSTDNLRNEDEWGELVASAGRKLARIATARPAFLREEEVELVDGYLKAAIKSRSWPPDDFVQIHGDFTLSNMLIDSYGTICILDFADSRIGAAASDAVRFDHDLWAIGELSRRRNAIITAMRNGFREAHGTVISSEMRVFLRCWNAVCFLASYVASRDMLGFTGKWAAKRLVNVHSSWLRREVINNQPRSSP